MEEKFGRATRELMLKETEEALRANPSFIITNYLGLKVCDMEELRKSLKKISVRYMVVKNSICKKVFENLKLSDFLKDIEGGIGIGLLRGDVDAASVSKVMIDFSKKKEALKLRSALIDGEYVSSDTIKKLATLPPRDILLSMVLQAMQGPITGFVGVLGGLLRKFLYAVSAIKDKKGKEGGQ